MSATTTTTATTRVRRTKTPATVATVLQDYEVYHSGDVLGSSTPEAPSPIPVSSTGDANPPGWDVTHRRVPPYRPTNRDREPGETNVYQNNIERAFITTMFAGLSVNAVSASGTIKHFYANNYHLRRQQRCGAPPLGLWASTGCLGMQSGERSDVVQCVFQYFGSIGLGILQYI